VTDRHLSEKVGAPQLTDLLRSRLREVSVLVEQRGEDALAGTSLTLPLNHLLDTVVAEPAVTVTEIARRLGKSQQAISLAADRLERLGFIERRIGSGRSIALHATEEGQVVSREGVQRELLSEATIRDALGQDRFDRLLSLLEDVRDALSIKDSGMDRTGRTK
jgi:DNA-binding MarR family transcriptional regulator